MMSFLHTYAPPWLSLMAGRCSIGETHQGLHGASAVTLPHGRDGPSVRRMAVLWTFRKSPICRPVHHQLMRNELLDLAPIIPTTPCHQRNYTRHTVGITFRRFYGVPAALRRRPLIM